MGMTPSKHSSSKHPIRAALYARISTVNHGQDPEVQLGEIREFCKRRGFTVAQEYVDRGISGSRERRPALDNLLAACRKSLRGVCAIWSTPSKNSTLWASTSSQFTREWTPALPTVG